MAKIIRHPLTVFAQLFSPPKEDKSSAGLKYTDCTETNNV